MLRGEKRKTDFAWDLLHNVIKLGGEAEAASCSGLLTGLGRITDVKRTNDLLAKMKEMNIKLACNLWDSY